MPRLRSVGAARPFALDGKPSASPVDRAAVAARAVIADANRGPEYLSRVELACDKLGRQQLVIVVQALFLELAKAVAAQHTSKT